MNVGWFYVGRVLNQSVSWFRKGLLTCSSLSSSSSRQRQLFFEEFRCHLLTRLTKLPKIKSRKIKKSAQIILSSLFVNFSSQKFVREADHSGILDFFEKFKNNSQFQSHLFFSGLNSSNLVSF